MSIMFRAKGEKVKIDFLVFSSAKASLDFQLASNYVENRRIGFRERKKDNNGQVGTRQQTKSDLDHLKHVDV